MKIKVVEINKFGNDEILITFSSPYGSARGFWMERNPEMNESYHVEFDIPQTLVWGKDIKKPNLTNAKYGMKMIIFIFAPCLIHLKIIVVLLSGLVNPLFS